MLYLIRCFSLLPLSVLYFLADVLIYPLIYYVARYRLRIVRRNLKASFPDKTSRELRYIEQQFYHHFADLLVEIVYGYRISDEEIRARVVFENVDLVEDLARQTRGVMVYLGHMGNWEWLVDLNKRFTIQGMTEYNVYRQLKSSQADKAMLLLRSKRGGECVEKKQLLRKLVSLRRTNQHFVVGMLSDQKPSKRSSYVWTEFLHQETAFLDGCEVLSKKFGYSAVYAYIWSTKRGYYRIRFENVAIDPSQMEAEEMTKSYASLLEKNIIEHPSMWLWTHNRWKWGRAELEG